MRSPSSPLSVPACPFLLLGENTVDVDELLPRRSDGGRGAADAEKDAALAHRWFRRIDEVTVWMSCNTSVIPGRSVGRDMVLDCVELLEG